MIERVFYCGIISSFYEYTNNAFMWHFDAIFTRSMLKGFKCGELSLKELFKISIP